jgi:16S rRNA (cytosine967-C5)-methyltransferase
LKPPIPITARQLALVVLRDVQSGVFADIAINRSLSKSSLAHVERHLFTELVYGITRRQRTLDAVIDRLASVPASKQPADLRSILQIGLYQLIYLDRIPTSAAVNTTVDLAKQNGLGGLSGVVNGILRQYIRLDKSIEALLDLPDKQPQKFGILHSFPDWLVEHWIGELGIVETEQLCQIFNRTPTIDLHVNPLKVDRQTVIDAFKLAGINVSKIDYLSYGLRLNDRVGSIDRLPGYDAGWWAVQDGSAQLVTQLLDPQPGETIIDACAAPGGKTSQMAELMGDRGKILALDKVASRLKKLQQNIDRLGLKSIEILTGNSLELEVLVNTADRVLLDAPCSGLGTLHRRADARWQKTPAQIEALATTQAQLLANTSRWVKPGGVLVYATCTVHPTENDRVILPFLAAHPDWHIERSTDPILANLTTTSGWIKVWPHRDDLDGFFMVKLRKSSVSG